MVDRVTLDSRAIVERAARLAADVLGDAAVVYERMCDGNLRVVQVTHRDPASEVVASTLAHDARTVTDFARSALRSGETLYMPQVPQRELRRRLHPELHEYLLASGCYSAICVPIGADAALLTTRDVPGRPYGRDDVTFVEAVGCRVARARARARRGAHALGLRRSVVDALNGAVDELPAAADAARTQTVKLLEQAVADDSQAAVALLDDLDLRHVACTKAYAVVLGDDPMRVTGTRLRSFVCEPEVLDEAVGGVLAGELDFRSVDLDLIDDHGRAILHLAMVRRRDATPWGVVATAHHDHELSSA
jgi:hypothetical protein